MTNIIFLDIAKYIAKGDRAAFDFSREKLAFAGDEKAIALAKREFATSNIFTEVGEIGSCPDEVRLASVKHNALWDAYIIKLCYDQIKAGG